MKKLHMFLMALLCLFLLPNQGNAQTTIWDFEGLAGLNEYYQLPCTPNPTTLNGFSVSWPATECINGTTAISILGTHPTQPNRPIRMGYGGLSEMVVDISGLNFNKVIISALFNTSGSGICLRDAQGNDVDCDYDDLGPNTSINNHRDYLLLNYDLTATQLVISGGTFDKFTFLSNVDQCFSPVNSTATASGSTATISWPANFGAVKYRIKYRKKGVGDTWTVLKPTDPTVTLNLELGTEYEYRLSTKCADGWQPFEEKQTFWTEPLEPCQAPQIISVNSIHSSKYKFVWTEVQNAEKYRIRYRKVGETTWTVKASSNNKKTLDLETSSDYEYELTTKCNGSWEPYGVTNNYTTFALCETVTGVRVLISNPGCDDRNDPTCIPPTTPDYRTIAWSTNPATTFQIQFRGFNVDPGPIYELLGDGWNNATTTATGDYFYHEGISQYAWVAYRMRALCSSGAVSEWSDIVYSFGLPNFQAATSNEVERGKEKINEEVDMVVPLNSDAVSIFPNPAQSQINIKVEQAKVAHMYIKDMQGRTLQQRVVVEGESNFQQNISELNTGVYLIVLRNEDGEQVTKRFVKLN